MSTRSKILSNKNKNKKQEQELRIFTNPFLNSQLRLLEDDDYQAPLTANSLKPNSKWIIVRNNLHKIRSWGGIKSSDAHGPMGEWYIFFQMRRELRRAQEYIRQVEQKASSSPIHYFYLPIDEKRRQRYNVSHIQPTDALYYPGLGHEPIVLQSLFYYFSKECAVPYNSTFRVFLADVCSIINQEQRRINRVAVFRKVALLIAIIVFIIIGLMLVALIFSVLKTTSDFRQFSDDDLTTGFNWEQPTTTLKPF